MLHPRYEQSITLNPSRFRRRTGVYPEVFADMFEALHDWHRRKTRAGHPPALRLEEQLMRTVEFWRVSRSQKPIRVRMEPPAGVSRTQKPVRVRMSWPQKLDGFE